ncbi:MAG: cobalamin biosynthesis protein CbiX [Deltaproteobacteria bacterium]|nr:cobalamin biosynthesis protein CbiX [Deltaproteobacteria bacterium]MBW2496665.1 cobalamin biosynthesis protein CbiX [Deltaproteobacteria bacterium]
MEGPARHRPALLIVDHGTRSKAANQQLEELACVVADERPDWLVQHAHMELGHPDLATGIERLIERGASEILVHLHFLGGGLHVRETIPALIEEARARHPGIPILLSEPLGRDPRLAEIVVGRMDDQLRGARQRSKA